MVFSSAVPGGDVNMTCVFAVADKTRMTLTWYRDRPSKPEEKLVTFLLSSTDHPDGRNEIEAAFRRRIQIPDNQDYKKNHSLTLLNVDSNDISKYWCVVVPDLYNSSYKRNKLKMEGVYAYMLLYLFLECFRIQSFTRYMEKSKL